MTYTAVVMQTDEIGSFVNMTFGEKIKGRQQWVVSFKTSYSGGHCTGDSELLCEL